METPVTNPEFDQQQFGPTVATNGPQYSILYADATEDLEGQVEDFLAQGWKLAGGVTYGGGELFQAIYKE